jgi:ankyrin repeat protein
MDMKANSTVKNINQETPLYMAANNNRVECLKHFIEKGADVIAADDAGQFLLQFAAKNGHYLAMKNLIENGADFRARDNSGKSILHLAAMQGAIECVSYLIGDLKFDVNARDYDCNTPLHTVGENFHTTKSDSRNFFWSTPLYKKDEPLHKKLFEVAEMLIKGGADLSSPNKDGIPPMKNKIVKELKQTKPELFLLDR